ncbi:phosphatase PAP2 family protein [Actinoplanes sp. OR16]|uniref:phosphatase PAP2 family protein n=1 Tax=Actinoplanes sp. OR16 TaxID=946334 RepID=UPI000F70018E|nr:phosphatase PAP2 family protein [Actinoplanes sp. OR16]BBH71077.1 phosphatase PAP2 family protein [Actinoplanes sp. OR16]
MHTSHHDIAVAARNRVAFPLLVPFVLLASLVAVRWPPLHDLDESVSERMHGVALSHPGWVDALTWLTHILSPTGWRLAVLALVIWLFRRGARSVAIWAAVTMIAGGLLGAVLKLLFSRARPEFLEPVAKASGYSFPSGHALNAALGAAILLLVLTPMVRGHRLATVGLWTAALGLPLVTALTRVGLGVHWLSDVTAGLFLGAAIAVASAAIHSRRGVPEPVEG